MPMKMEPIRSSETSAIKTQTPGNYPKRNIQGGSNMTGTDLCVNKCKQFRSYLNHLVLQLKHGESLKTRR